MAKSKTIKTIACIYLMSIILSCGIKKDKNRKKFEDNTLQIETSIKSDSILLGKDCYHLFVELRTKQDDIMQSKINFDSVLCTQYHCFQKLPFELWTKYLPVDKREKVKEQNKPNAMDSFYAFGTYRYNQKGKISEEADFSLFFENEYLESINLFFYKNPRLKSRIEYIADENGNILQYTESIPHLENLNIKYNNKIIRERYAEYPCINIQQVIRDTLVEN